MVTGLTAMPVAYQLAEGATGRFFDTDLLLANPTTSNVAVTVTYVTEARPGRDAGPHPGAAVAHDRVCRRQRAARRDGVLGHRDVASGHPDRGRAHAALGRHRLRHAHGEDRHSLSRTWLFAEGAQGFYQTFFLLTNPSPAPNVATLRFLRENGSEVTRTFALAPQSRRTIFAGDIPELVNQSFGTVVTFAFAGAAERAMYFGSPVFNGGHESAGATRPSTNWFLAEGATGSFFTTFVLVSNPNATPATVTMTYFREGGGTITRTRTMPAASRLTVNVALEDASLAATSVATRVTSDVPIVAERSMYWPFDAGSWQEAHNAFGVTETAPRWALAEGRVGGPFAFQTFVLVANPERPRPT